MLAEEAAMTEKYIPAAYNTETQLDAQVTADGPNEFSFELSADGSAPKWPHQNETSFSECTSQS